MKKMVSFLVILTLLMVVACGGNDDTEEPTTTPEPTQAETPTPTPEATAEPTQAITPEPTVEPTPPTPTATPEPTVEPTVAVGTDSVESVLADVMSDLVLAFGNVDGEWQGYAGSSVLPLTTLENGSVYYWYATEDSILPGSSIILSTGWNMKVWMAETGPIVTSLDNYENAIPFVITTDGKTMQSYLYQSTAVSLLTEIVDGQTYEVFTVSPDSPIPSMFQLP